MSNNPLIAPILNILKSSDDAIKEYDLIKKLETTGINFSADEDSSELALFKKHFLVMNALYHLQKDLLEDGLFLQVDPLCIKFEVLNCASDSMSLSEMSESKLAEYYLDWANYENTSQQDVNEMLNGFWDSYYAIDKKSEALQVLGITTDVSLDYIKKSYRKLVAQHHPDKGGDQQRFIEIREAYEVLKCCY